MRPLGFFFPFQPVNLSTLALTESDLLFFFPFQPVNLSTLALTESALARYEKTEAETWTGNHHPQYETIHGQNR